MWVMAGGLTSFSARRLPADQRPARSVADAGYSENTFQCELGRSAPTSAAPACEDFWRPGREAHGATRRRNAEGRGALGGRNEAGIG